MDAKRNIAVDRKRNKESERGRERARERERKAEILEDHVHMFSGLDIATGRSYIVLF